MESLSYKFIFLDDEKASVNQSRGINIQFNGYVPVTCSSSNYLSDLITNKQKIDIKSAISSNKMVLMFKGGKYISANGTTTPNDGNYSNYLKDPGKYMFQDLNVMGADELKYIDENGSQRNTLSIEVPLSDTMFGDKLSGTARIDALLFYGQAYNPMFNYPDQQGYLERSVPVAIMVFAPSGSGDKPTITPSNSSKVKNTIRVGLTVISGEGASTEVVESDIFKDWAKLAGSMHVVNDGLATSANFVVRGHDINTAPLEGSDVLFDDKTINVATRMFFSEDPDGTNNDMNVDFGSPARLNVMNYDAISEGKKPQFMISKVRNWKDDTNHDHADWDGVVASWYSESGTIGGLGTNYPPIVGSTYDIDWVSKENPLISIFSEDVKFNSNQYSIYGDCSPFPKSPDNYDVVPGMKDRYEHNKKYASGRVLFSKNVFARDESTVIDSEDIEIHGGNAVVLGTRNVISSTHPTIDNGAVGDEYYGRTFISNSYDIEIEDCEEHPWTDPIDGTPAMFDKQCQNLSNNTILGSYSISISNRYQYFDYFGDTNPNGSRKSRNLVASSDKVLMTMSDRVFAIGLKGQCPWGRDVTYKVQKRYYKHASWDKNWACDGNTSVNNFIDYPGYETSICSREEDYYVQFNEINRSEDAVFIGGTVHATDVKGVMVLGVGVPNSKDYGSNIVEGFRAYNETTQRVTGHAYRVEYSAILGIDNRISTIFPEMADTKGWRHWCKGRVSDVYEIGVGLNNDVRQQNWLEGEIANSHGAIRDNNNTEKNPATLIIGSRNGYYSQKGKWVKQIVVGGYKTKGIKGLSEGQIPWWKYNSYEFKSEWVGACRNAIAVQDMKGRQVMYTSLGVNLGFMKGKRGAEQYEKYRYSDLGNINFFKLYRLLRHLYYDYETGYVKFNMFDESTQPESSYPVKFHNQGKGYDGNASTCLADLVDDEDHCYYPYFPMGKPYSDGGGVDHIGPGGGDVTDSSSGGGGSSGGETGTVNIGGRDYTTKRFGSVIWLTNNITLIGAGITLVNPPTSTTEGQANYYNITTDYGDTLGLLYNYTALNNVIQLLSNGWRIPTLNDYNSLFSQIGAPTVSPGSSQISAAYRNLLCSGNSGFNIFCSGQWTTACCDKDYAEYQWVKSDNSYFVFSLALDSNTTATAKISADSGSSGYAYSIRLCKDA